MNNKSSHGLLAVEHLNEALCLMDAENAAPATRSRHLSIAITQTENAVLRLQADKKDKSAPPVEAVSFQTNPEKTA